MGIAFPLYRNCKANNLLERPKFSERRGQSTWMQRKPSPIAAVSVRHKPRVELLTDRLTRNPALLERRLALHLPHPKRVLSGARKKRAAAAAASANDALWRFMVAHALRLPKTSLDTLSEPRILRKWISDLPLDGLQAGHLQLPCGVESDVPQKQGMHPSNCFEPSR